LRTAYVLAFSIIVLSVVFAPFLTYSTLSGEKESKYLDSLCVNIEEGDIVKIEIKHQNNDNDQYQIVLPFEVKEEISHHPSSALLLWDNYQNRYSVFSIMLPANTSEFSIIINTNKLVRAIGDLKKVGIDFSYTNTPDIITQFMAMNNTYYLFETVQVTLPGIDAFISETPTAYSLSGNARVYTMSDITKKADSQLTVVYSLTETNAWVEFLASLALGFPSLLGVILISPEKIKERKIFFILLCLVLVLALLFFTQKFLVYGITWDFLSKYYGGLLVNCLVVSAKTILSFWKK